MITLQELISRARFVMSGAPQRLGLFRHINGRRNTSQLARLTQRHKNNIRRDLTRLEEVGLIQKRIDAAGSPIIEAGQPLYEKVALARSVPLRYFTEPTAVPKAPETKAARGRLNRERRRVPACPSEVDILAICRAGEDQTYEFKGAGTDVGKIAREAAAMANTTFGGVILYGVDDDGVIEGAAVRLQKLDQPLQNSLRTRISPALTVELRQVVVTGSLVIVVLVPFWPGNCVYHFDERVLIRKGTNAFGAKPEESARLHRGNAVL